MKVSFQLTMPNVGSWNGKWTGAEKKYYKILSFRTKEQKDRTTELLEGKPYQNFYYDFGDGWGANVRMEIVEAGEARRRIRNSAGFCGYDWMVKSILNNGKIMVEKEVETA